MMRYAGFLMILWCMHTVQSADAQSPAPAYDSTLAASLGADDYGMKWYVLAILKTGPNDIQDKALRDSLFAGHFSNMDRMAEAGQLIVAGPIAKNDKTYRGIFILNVPTLEEATQLIQSDPTIKQQILEAELYRWYGSAALPTYLDDHDRIQKQRIE